MKIKRVSEDIIRQVKINGALYEFTRYEDLGHVEIFARKWTGYTWIRVHHWRGSK